jgi:hypothetical protein
VCAFDTGFDAVNSLRNRVSVTPLRFKGVEVGPGISRTENPHELHEISTIRFAKKPYSESLMRRAFVVQLREAGQGAADRMEGSVEEIDTGKQYHFRSEDGLIRFLRERFAESCRSSPLEDTK